MLTIPQIASSAFARVEERLDVAQWRLTPPRRADAARFFERALARGAVAPAQLARAMCDRVPDRALTLLATEVARTLTQRAFPASLPRVGTKVLPPFAAAGVSRPEYRSALAQWAGFLIEDGHLPESELEAALNSQDDVSVVCAVARAWHAFVVAVRSEAEALVTSVKRSDTIAWIAPMVLCPGALNGRAEEDLLTSVTLEAEPVVGTSWRSLVADQDARNAVESACRLLSESLECWFVVGPNEMLEPGGPGGYFLEMLADANNAITWTNDEPVIPSRVVRELGEELGWDLNKPDTRKQAIAYFKHARNPMRPLTRAQLKQWLARHPRRPWSQWVAAVMRVVELLGPHKRNVNAPTGFDFGDAGVPTFYVTAPITGLEQVILHDQWESMSNECEQPFCTMPGPLPQVAPRARRAILETCLISAIKSLGDHCDEQQLSANTQRSRRSARR